MLELVAAALAGAYEVTHSFAAAVAAVSFVLTLSLTPLSLPSVRLAVVTADLGPELARLREAHSGDAAAARAATAELYRVEGARPGIGCLGALAQVGVVVVLVMVVLGLRTAPPEGPRHAGASTDLAQALRANGGALSFLGVDLARSAWSVRGAGADALPYLALPALAGLAGALGQRAQVGGRGQRAAPAAAVVLAGFVVGLAMPGAVVVYVAISAGWSAVLALAVRGRRTRRRPGAARAPRSPAVAGHRLLLAVLFAGYVVLAIGLRQSPDFTQRGPLSLVEPPLAVQLPGALPPSAVLDACYPDRSPSGVYKVVGGLIGGVPYHACYRLDEYGQVVDVKVVDAQARPVAGQAVAKVGGAWPWIGLVTGEDDFDRTGVFLLGVLCVCGLYYRVPRPGRQGGRWTAALWLLVPVVGWVVMVRRAGWPRTRQLVLKAVMVTTGTSAAVQGVNAAALADRWGVLCLGYVAAASVVGALAGHRWVARRWTSVHPEIDSALPTGSHPRPPSAPPRPKATTGPHPQPPPAPPRPKAPTPLQAFQRACAEADRLRARREPVAAAMVTADGVRDFLRAAPESQLVRRVPELGGRLLAVVPVRPSDGLALLAELAGRFPGSLPADTAGAAARAWVQSDEVEQFDADWTSLGRLVAPAPPVPALVHACRAAASAGVSRAFGVRASRFFAAALDATLHLADRPGVPADEEPAFEALDVVAPTLGALSRADHYCGLGDAALGRGDTREAGARYEVAVTLGSAEARPRLARVLAVRGHADLVAGDAVAARAAFHDAVAIDPDPEYKLLAEIAAILAGSMPGGCERHVQRLRKLSEGGVPAVDVAFWMAVAYLLEGQDSLAADALSGGSTDGPSNHGRWDAADEAALFVAALEGDDAALVAHARRLVRKVGAVAWLEEGPADPWPMMAAVARKEPALLGEMVGGLNGPTKLPGWLVVAAARALLDESLRLAGAGRIADARAPLVRAERLLRVG